MIPGLWSLVGAHCVARCFVTCHRERQTDTATLEISTRRGARSRQTNVVAAALRIEDVARGAFCVCARMRAPTILITHYAKRTQAFFFVRNCACIPGRVVGGTTCWRRFTVSAVVAVYGAEDDPYAVPAFGTCCLSCAAKDQLASIDSGICGVCCVRFGFFAGAACSKNCSGKRSKRKVAGCRIHGSPGGLEASVNVRQRLVKLAIEVFVVVGLMLPRTRGHSTAAEQGASRWRAKYGRGSVSRLQQPASPPRFVCSRDPARVFHEELLALCATTCGAVRRSDATSRTVQSAS